MTKAFGNLDTREIGYRNYKLLSDFWYFDPLLGEVRAKQGFETNYASIDILKYLLLFTLYALLAGYGDKAATIHDWLYSGYGIERENGVRYFPSRKECDQVLYRALKAEGVAHWRCVIFYAGVRIGGWKAFSKSHATFIDA